MVGFNIIDLGKFINSVKDLKALEGVWFKREKGEALRKLSTPDTDKEASSLGYFEALSNITGNSLKTVEVYMNLLSGVEDYHLSHLVDNIFRSSGSRKAKRMELVADTIKEAKPEITMSRDFPEPEAIDAKSMMAEKT